MKKLNAPIVILDGEEYINNGKSGWHNRLCRLYTLDDGTKLTVSMLEKKIGSTGTCARARLKTHTDPKKVFRPLRDQVTKEEMEPDESFLRAIEEQIGITGSSRDGFRSDVTAYMFAKMRHGDKIDYTSYGPLKEAIEYYLISSVKDIARIVTKSKTRDDEQKQKYSDMVRTMINEYGYNELSAEEVLTFAANNLWRDS